MAANRTIPTIQKITISLPVDLVSRLNALVASRRRSQFIAQAIEERLAIEEQTAALEESAGAWSAENHPDLDRPEAVDRWVRELRASWERPLVADNE
jgi:predicted transcriptional regulator